MQQYESIQKRIDILNSGAIEKSVLDSIDRPIRPLVIELNRIGLVTTFSCCGFTYDGQEEPKSHDNKPYVLFYVPSDIRVIRSFFHLASIVPNLSWGLNIASNGYEWCLFSFIPEQWTNQDNLKEPIHSYELRVVHIIKLVKALKEFPSFSEKFVVTDGNSQRRSLYGNEWMIAPKKEVQLEVGQLYSNIND